MSQVTIAAIYLRLSDGVRDGEEDTFPDREAALRERAADLGWQVGRVVIENDVDKRGRIKPASAYERKLVTLLDGRKRYRTDRPRWRDMLDAVEAGRFQAILVEDADRLARDVHDGEDLLDVAEISSASVADATSMVLTKGGTPDEQDRVRDKIRVARKSSADTSRRVKAGRKRAAAKGSWGGGTRPFGYLVDEDGSHYRRGLIRHPEEAAAIRQAAEDILHGVSLASTARRWRQDGPPTVTGSTWTGERVRTVMRKPLLCGLVSLNGSLHRAFWAEAEAILDETTWRAVVAKLASDTVTYVQSDGTVETRQRKTITSNVPKHLLSCLATCGVVVDGKVCGSQVVAHTSGKAHRHPKYVCRSKAHLGRSLPLTDEYVTSRIVAVIADDPDLLAPEPPDGADLTALREEENRLEEAGKAAMRLLNRGLISEEDLATSLTDRDALLVQVRGKIAAAEAPARSNPAEGAPRGGDREAVRAWWDGLPLARQRAIISAVYEIRVDPAGRHQGGKFDTSLIKLRRRTERPAAA